MSFGVELHMHVEQLLMLEHTMGKSKDSSSKLQSKDMVLAILVPQTWRQSS